MTALWMGTILLSILLGGGLWLIDRQADRNHEIRWQERFYQPQLPVRQGPVRDAQSWPVEVIDRS